MCNLYSETKGQDAIRALFRTAHDRTGNLPAFPGIFPDQLAPIVRNDPDGERELVVARWGMPGPRQFGGQPVTNIRNVASPHWRGWLGTKNRCLVPATSFCEYEDTKPSKTPTWFALSEDLPLFAFAGLWTRWRGGDTGGRATICAVGATGGRPKRAEDDLKGGLRAAFLRPPRLNALTFRPATLSLSTNPPGGAGRVLQHPCAAAARPAVCRIKGAGRSLG
jgi:hypothetical protein